MDVRNFLIEEFETNSRRYLGVVFTSNSPQELIKIHQKLQQHLCPVEEWAGPGQFSAPQIPITRLKFCDSVFREKHPDGLIINFPEDWMFDWSDDDKRVFWTELSQTYGINKIFVITAGSPSNIQMISKSFISRQLNNSNITAWTSKYDR